MKKSIYIIASFFIFLFIAGGFIEAKLLPRWQKASQNSAASVSDTRYVSAKLRADRKALLVTFSNLQNAKGVDYVLTYKSNGVDQGINGSIDLAAGNSANRTLLFGTESSGVYTYHTNITDMRFIVTIVPKSGRTIVKPYIVKP